MHPTVELYLKGKKKFKQKTEEVVMQNESKKCMFWIRKCVSQLTTAK